MRVVVLLGLVLATGVALLLSELRWFRRPRLADRLRPYASGALQRSGPDGGVLSVGSLRDLLAPLGELLGSRLARLVGVSESLERRLDRVGATVDPTVFRTRQLAWAGASFVATGLATVVIDPPTLLGLFVVLGAPLLAFLVLEQQVVERSTAWQRRTTLELPVVAEQLGLLLSAGYSLGAALNRVARRGQGACGHDLERVCTRIRQGLSDVAALREWSDRVSVPAVERLVAVLALNREAGDLGRLITEEARSVRRDGHRQLLAAIDRRSQQVWIPVTVAALVPGVLFLSIPFIEALSLVSGS